VDNRKAIENLKTALKLAKSETDKATIEKSIAKIN
jgi:hypothetical protein